MNFARYAKAWVALATGLLAALAQFTPLASGGLSGLVAAIGAFATALAVYLVANKTHGFNVNDIADALIGAALDPDEDDDGGAHDGPG